MLTTKLICIKMNNIPITFATFSAVGGLVFYAGQQSHRIDELFRRAHAAEHERKDTRDLIFDIHGKVSGIERDIQYVKDKM